ncbi:hypothetical protein Tco_1066349 [Tanacetum coccineum]|uniref:Uncharacterized protein n=1 Tax=Tanacetum coccineum TaxID=301880 RepID=A0ABQ5H9U1_9ASTR
MLQVHIIHLHRLQIQELSKQLHILHTLNSKLDKEREEVDAKTVCNSLPTKLKELPSKFNDLSGEIKELKKYVEKLKVELPRDLKEIPTKLEKFTSTVSSIQAKIKTLDALLSLLSKVTKALHRFAKAVEKASRKSGDQGVPSADQASLLNSEGELIRKTRARVVSSKDAGKEGTESESNEEDNLTGSIVRSSKPNKLKQFDFKLKKGTYYTEGLSKQKKARWSTIYEKIKKRMDYLHKTKVELEIDFSKPFSEQDPLDKLNDLAIKKRKHVDDIHDYFRSTKKFKSLVQYEDHPARTVLNNPCLEIFFKLHQGHFIDDHARTFSFFLLAKVGKRNLNPLKQMRTIKKLR